MSLSDNVLAEFDHETAVTRRVVERVSQEQLGWSPHQKSMTLARLATHVAEIPKFGDAMLREAVFDLGGENRAERSLDSVDKMLRAFDEGVSAVRARIGTMTDAEWTGIWTLKSGGRVLMTLPRAAAFRGWVMNHMIHHRGQLTVYLRQTGSLVPGIYGPSADQRPGPRD